MNAYCKDGINYLFPLIDSFQSRNWLNSCHKWKTIFHWFPFFQCYCELMDFFQIQNLSTNCKHYSFYAWIFTTWAMGPLQCGSSVFSVCVVVVFLTQSHQSWKAFLLFDTTIYSRLTCTFLLRSWIISPWSSGSFYQEMYLETRILCLESWLFKFTYNAIWISQS